MAPGRKSIEAQIADEQKRADEARARIASLKARQRTVSRKQDAHRKIIVGGAIMTHIKISAPFRKAVMEALNVAVTEKRHRDAIPDLLDEKAYEESMRAEARNAAAKETDDGKSGPPVKKDGPPGSAGKKRNS